MNYLRISGNRRPLSSVNEKSSINAERAVSVLLWQHNAAELRTHVARACEPAFSLVTLWLLSSLDHWGAFKHHFL